MRNNHLLLLAFLFVILPVLPLRGQEVKKIAILEPWTGRMRSVTV